MSLIPPASRARAEATLTGACTITRPTGSTFTAGQAPTAGAPTAVWSGPCSLLPPSTNDRSDTGGDDRRIPTRPLLLPVAAIEAGVMVGDRCTIDGARYIVSRLDDRTNAVLYRLQVTATVDAPGVPQ